MGLDLLRTEDEEGVPEYSEDLALAACVFSLDHSDQHRRGDLVGKFVQSFGVFVPHHPLHGVESHRVDLAVLTEHLEIVEVHLHDQTYFLIVLVKNEVSVSEGHFLPVSLVQELKVHVLAELQVVGVGPDLARDRAGLGSSWFRSRDVDDGLLLLDPLDDAHVALFGPCHDSDLVAGLEQLGHV
jgi:hypothetical protein